MIDTTERPTSSSKLAKGEARYNEFGCNIVRKNEVVAYKDRESFVLADVFGFLAWILCATKSFYLSGEIKPVTVGESVYYYNSWEFKLNVKKTNCMRDDFNPVYTMQLNYMEPKAEANHMNI